MDWNTHLPQQLAAATALVRQGQLADATQAIQAALGGLAVPPSRAPMPAGAAPSGLAAFFDGSAFAPGAAASFGAAQDTAPRPAPRATPGASAPTEPARRRFGAQAPDVEDAVLREPAPATGNACADRNGTFTAADPIAKGSARAASHPASPHSAEAPGSFTRVAIAHGGAQHHYWLYVPPGAAKATLSTPMPLVLMLHGCTQNPQDFATGTGMNAAAAAEQGLVLYPAQPREANANGCWNWFVPGHQQRDKGEPALLVAMVREVMARHPVDARRVYAAGLSAGGAMAALLGREYPDVFAAIGVHSGLQAGAAHNTMAALSAMKNGAKPGPHRPRKATAPPLHRAPALIVFHGDADSTVHARNGEQLVQAALGALQGGAATVQPHAQQGQSTAGQRFTRTVYRRTDATSTEPHQAVVAEHWLLQGAGHAWAGGHPGGSHTDARGVNATHEMLRFFLEHPRAD